MRSSGVYSFLSFRIPDVAVVFACVAEALTAIYVFSMIEYRDSGKLIDVNRWKVYLVTEAANYYRNSGKMEPLHEIVKKHRRMSSLSQAELAKLAGVGKTVVFDLEHGKLSIRFDTLTKILAVLNISIGFDSPLMVRMRDQTASTEKRSA